MKHRAAYDMLMLLASSGFSLTEVVSALDAISNMSARERRNAIKEAYYLIDDTKKSTYRSISRGGVVSNPDLDVGKYGEFSVDPKSIEKIEWMLRGEANIPVKEAAYLLTHDIEARYPKIQLPSLGKRSFGEWLGRLVEVVPPRELMSIATRIRNKYVHEIGDWKLKSE